MEPYKYKFTGSCASNIQVASNKEWAKTGWYDIIDKIPLPNANNKDLLAFWNVYVQSGANKNLAWFDQKELTKAGFSIPFKSVDIEHDVLQNCGIIIDYRFINRDTKKIIDSDELKLYADAKLRKTNIDVVTGGYIFSDRYPTEAYRVECGSVATSMEVYMSDWLLRLNDDLILTQDEANALGLSFFVDRLLDTFASQEDLIKAHTLKVIAAEGITEQLVVYKYLKELHFSGMGLVDTPACVDCSILDCSIGVTEEDLKMAASQVVSDAVCDLRKLDRYMKSYQEGNKISVTSSLTPCSCKEQADPAVPPNMLPAPSPTAVPPDSTPDYTPTNDVDDYPGRCTQYKDTLYQLVSDSEGYRKENLLEKKYWCLREDVQCAADANTQNKTCVRWKQLGDDSWEFDFSDKQTITIDGVTLFDKAEYDALKEKEIKLSLEREKLHFESIKAKLQAILAQFEED